jgi:hypothetical protein
LTTRIGIKPIANTRTNADGAYALYRMIVFGPSWTTLSATPVQPLFFSVTSTPMSADL